MILTPAEQAAWMAARDEWMRTHMPHTMPMPPTSDREWDAIEEGERARDEAACEPRLGDLPW